MGTWGPAIFSDDTAMDVRTGYREMIEDGASGEEATRAIMREFSGTVDDPDEGPVFWVALAATQWKLGRLEDNVKERALQIIDSGAGLEIWEEDNPSLLPKRKAALQKLRDQLMSPQPPVKKVRKPKPFYMPSLRAGDAITYRLDSGKSVILRVVGIEESRYGMSPVVELCDWIGDTAPPPKQIERLPAVTMGCHFGGTRFMQVLALKKEDYPEERIELVARRLRMWGFIRDRLRSSCGWLYIHNWLHRVAPQLNAHRPRRLFRARPTSLPYTPSEHAGS